MKGNTGGEIVQVEGGHIIRATGRKDRHSKVVTAKGARDRRVRLSAHTAIQFYDVQDRLRYDRPSKAVDWLIKKAKSSIDKLDELPPLDPTTATVGSATAGIGSANANNYKSADLSVGGGGSSNYDMAMVVGTDHGSSDYGLHQVQSHLHHHNNNDNECSPPSGGNGGGGNDNSYVPQPPMDLSDTMKPFFPMSNNNSSGTDGGGGENSIGFHDQYLPPHHHDMISRGGGGRSHTQDLCLSLQSFQDHRAGGTDHDSHHQMGSIFSPTSAAAMASFGEPNSGGVWGQQQQQHHHQSAPVAAADMGRFSRLLAWNSSTNGSSSSGSANQLRGSFMFSSPIIQQQQSHQEQQQQGAAALLFGQIAGGSSFPLSHQRGTLQSNYSPIVSLDWDDIHAHEHQQQLEEHHRKPQLTNYRPHLPSMAAAAAAYNNINSDGFMGFCIPSAGGGINGSDNGEQHQHVHGNIVSNKDTSMSPDSS